MKGTQPKSELEKGMVLRKRWNSQTLTKEATLPAHPKKFWLKSVRWFVKKKKASHTSSAAIMKKTVGSQIDFLAQGLVITSQLILTVDKSSVHSLVTLQSTKQPLR